MKRIFWTLFLLALTVRLSAEIAITNINANFLPRIFLLPLSNATEIQDYPGSGIFREMSYKSFYQFIEPRTNVEFQALQPAQILSMSPIESYRELDQYLREQMPDLIIEGSYRYTGSQNAPVVEAALSIRKLNSSVIDTRNFELETDRRIFDGIDEMIDVISEWLNSIRVHSPPVNPDSAVVYFHNFNVGNESYEIWLNGHRIARGAGQNFEKKVPLEPGISNNIIVKSESSDKPVLETNLLASLGETVEIAYSARGVIRVNSMRDKEQWEKYSYYLNGSNVTENSLLSNEKAGINYDFSVIRSDSNTVYHESFYLQDNAYQELSPFITWKGGFHAKIIMSYSGNGGLGLDYQWFCYLWTGVSLSFGSYFVTNGVQNMNVLYPSAEIGYFFWGDLSYNFRVGTGITAQYAMIVPEIQIRKDYSITTYPYEYADKTDWLKQQDRYNLYSGIGVFLAVEYLNFFLRPAFYYTFSDFRLNLTGGLKF